MNKIRGFKITFEKSTKHISESTDLTVNELYEAGDKSLDYAETLIYFVTAHSQQHFHEIDADGFEIYMANMREIIGGFFYAARENFAQLEDLRTKQEKTVENISTIG